MRPSPARGHLNFAASGLLFGFLLSWVGFSDWGEIHRMFSFADLRLLFTFGGAVMLAGVAFAFIKGSRTESLRAFHPGSIPGGALFGVGWAVCGACPSIAVVQLGEGQLGAIFTVLGVLFGTWLYGAVHSRFFRWDAGSCDR